MSFSSVFLSNAWVHVCSCVLVLCNSVIAPHISVMCGCLLCIELCAGSVEATLVEAIVAVNQLSCAWLM